MGRGAKTFGWSAAVLTAACTLSSGAARAQEAHDMASMPGMDHSAHMAAMAGMDHAAGSMPATGNLGDYPMTRDASGTSWQPDVSTHNGVHGMAGGWSLMGHATLNVVTDRHRGLRGDSKTFPAGMIMGAARPHCRRHAEPACDAEP